ncbi:MAG: hypothetical protein LC676_08870 [Loktanella sp.]|nr:hypothetical protein [Loktanella sp.]
MTTDTDQTAITDYETIPGTEQRDPYIVFGARGKFAIGVRILGFQSKGQHTLFSFRIRAAARGETNVDETVIAFADLKLEEPKDAWPDIEWDKAAADRASSVILTQFNGSLNEPDEETDELLEKITSGKLGRMVADHVTGLIPDAHHVLTGSQLARALNDLSLVPAGNSMKARVEHAKQIETTMAENPGAFHTASKLASFKPQTETDQDDT